MKTDKNKIYKLTAKHYTYECGDGCCYETGYDYFVDGKKVTDGTDAFCDLTVIEDILKHFGINCEADFQYDEEEGEN
jgi:hypothetical protein